MHANGGAPAVAPRSEIADTLAVLHRGFGDAVVRARLAALGDAVAAISSTTASVVAASETTPPVQLMSPTVRKRTEALNGSSVSMRST